MHAVWLSEKEKKVWRKIIYEINELGMVACTFNPNTKKAEAGGSLTLSPVRSR